jgi:hypothetical protein
MPVALPPPTLKPGERGKSRLFTVVFLIAMVGMVLLSVWFLAWTATNNADKDVLAPRNSPETVRGFGVTDGR